MRAKDECFRAICASSKGKRQWFFFFDILRRQHEHKSKTDSEFFNFPSVKFRKIRQTGNKYFTLSWSLFFRDTHLTSFSAVVKDINFQKSKKLHVQPYFFRV